MRKIITFLATAAFSCCGISSLFAQIQIMDGSTNPSYNLISGQTELGEVSSPVAQEAIGNPFDFFKSEAPAAASSEGASPSDVDPTSLPVGRQLHNRTIVDTINDHATVSAVPNASMAPVFWNQQCRTPNPVAEVLLRDQCNACELWLGYPAQRAAECEHMWSKIAGHAHQCGCAAPSGCKSCQQPVHNRYVQQSQPCGCDQQQPIAPVVDAPQPQPIVPAAAERPVDESEAKKKVAFLSLPWTR